jgi:hypothetical protein
MVSAVQVRVGEEISSTSTIISTTRVLTTGRAGANATLLEISAEAIRVTNTSASTEKKIVGSEMIGKRTQITVSNLGDIRHRKVIDKFHTSDIMRAAIQRTAVRFHPYPGKPVRIGDKWKATRTDTSDLGDGSMVTVSNVEYTLAAREKRSGKQRLKLTFNGTLTLTKHGTTEGKKVFVEGVGETKGYCYIDPVSGMADYDVSTSDIRLTSEIAGQQKTKIHNAQHVVSRRSLLSG